MPISLNLIVAEPILQTTHKKTTSFLNSTTIHNHIILNLGVHKLKKLLFTINWVKNLKYKTDSSNTVEIKTSHLKKESIVLN